MKNKTRNVLSVVCELFEASHILTGSADRTSHPTYKIGDVGQGLSEWNRNAYITAHEQKQPTCAFETMADSLVHKYLTNVTKRFYVDRTSNCNKTANIRMHIDLGHHIIMGLGDSLARLISPDRLAFIRLRRNRTSTAISFYSSRAIPCGGYYNSSEANLGHDEVEARWQMFIQKYPDLVYLETDPWNTGADLMNILSDSATFLEGLLRKTHRALGSVHVLPENTTSKGHAHTSAKDYLKDRSEEIKQYTSIMAYSSNVKKLLQGSTTDNYN